MAWCKTEKPIFLLLNRAFLPNQIPPHSFSSIGILFHRGPRTVKLMNVNRSHNVWPNRPPALLRLSWVLKHGHSKLGTWVYIMKLKYRAGISSDGFLLDASGDLLERLTLIVCQLSKEKVLSSSVEEQVNTLSLQQDSVFRSSWTWTCGMRCSDSHFVWKAWIHMRAQE